MTEVTPDALGPLVAPSSPRRRVKVAQKPSKPRGRPPLPPEVVAQREAVKAAKAAKAAARRVAATEAKAGKAKAPALLGRPRRDPAKALGKLANLPIKEKSAPAYWRAKEIAERYGISTALVFRLVNGTKEQPKVLPSRKVGRAVLVPVAATKAFFERGETVMPVTVVPPIKDHEGDDADA